MTEAITQPQPFRNPTAGAILETLLTIVPDRECIEMRGQNLKGFWWSGFYDKEHLERLAHDAVVMDPQSKGIYLTLNTTNPALLARRANHLETYGIKKDSMTCDDDITRWDYLPIDVDAKKPAGISSTQEEIDAALDVAERIIAYLFEYDFGKPLLAFSGNGWHLLYKICLERSPENDVIVKKILYALSAKFDTNAVGVDVSNNNASRIFKLYGTVARKGENSAERPHRLSYIKEVPDLFKIVHIDTLLAFIKAHKETPAVAEKAKGKARLKAPKDVVARHPEFLKIVGKMVHSNFPYDAIYAACEKVNAGFDNPKTDEFLAQEIKNIYDHCVKKQAEIDELPPYIYPIVDEDTDEITGYGLDYGKYATYLYKNFSVINFKGYLYIYDTKNHVYKENLNEIGTEIRDTYLKYRIGDRISTVQKEIGVHLANMGNEVEYPFDKSDGIIPVMNCALKISDGKIERISHSAEIKKTIKLPVVYDPAAPTQPVLDVLSQWVEGQDVQILVQIVAQALYQQSNRTTLKRNYLLQGETDAGKSTYLDLLKIFCGETQISDVSLQEICSDVRFLSARLESKILNVYDDLKDIPLAGSGKLKKLDGRVTHEIERKGKTPYIGNITCPHVFSCNQPPSYDEDLQYDEAWWNRWDFVSFPYSYVKDSTFQTKTFTQQFLSGFLNLILDEIVKIDSRGQLTINRTSGEIRDRWGMLSNPLKMWIRDNFEPSDEFRIYSKRKLFDAYTSYCEDTEVPMKKRIATEDNFGRKLPGEGFVTMQVPDPQVKKAKLWVWRSKLSWKGKQELVSVGGKLES